MSGALTSAAVAGSKSSRGRPRLRFPLCRSFSSLAFLVLSDFVRLAVAGSPMGRSHRCTKLTGRGDATMILAESGHRSVDDWRATSWCRISKWFVRLSRCQEASSGGVTRRWGSASARLTWHPGSSAEIRNWWQLASEYITPGRKQSYEIAHSVFL